jgi:hypothetical protein
VRTPRSSQHPTGRRTLAVLVLVVMLGTVPGCGGTSDGVGGSTSPDGRSSTTAGDEPGGCDLSDLLGGDDDAEVAGGSQEGGAQPDAEGDTEPCLDAPAGPDE